MAKKAYIGIDNIARKIKKGYVGIDSIARKVKKGYVGIGGVARPCFGGGKLSYYGAITSLSAARSHFAATTIGNYALFGGGTDGTAYSTVEAYDASLTRTFPTELSVARYTFSATTVGNYALFCGGYGADYRSTVDAYDTSLTRTLPAELSAARCDLKATKVGNYALFGGGYDSAGYYATVDAYNTSLTRTLPTELSVARADLSATTVGDYALFGGGTVSVTSKATVDAYNTSLTRTLPTELSVARRGLAATSVGDYALFGGGGINYSLGSSTRQRAVDAYNKSLTRTTPTVLLYPGYGLAATTVDDYALFGGGGETNLSFSNSILSAVTAYDTSLTRTLPTELSVARMYLAATTVGNYALFGGGLRQDYKGGEKTYYSTVDAYTII